MEDVNSLIEDLREEIVDISWWCSNSDMVEGVLSILNKLNKKKKEKMKIKTFKSYNDDIVNEFIRQTRGKIVNYNPIIVEYDKKNKFVDPYLGYDAYLYKCQITYTSIKNIDTTLYDFVDSSKVFSKQNVDTVLFDKKTGRVSFVNRGNIVVEINNDTYVNLSLGRKHISRGTGLSPVHTTPIDTGDFGGESFSDIDYGFAMYADSGWGEFFDFRAYLDAINCEKINFE